MKQYFFLFLTIVHLNTYSQVDSRQISFDKDTVYIKDSIKTFKALQYLNFYFSNLPIEFALKYAPKIDSQYLETKENKELNQKISLAPLSNKGLVITNFRLLSNTNDSLSLLELTKKHKLILIDFWASWCLPCRKNSLFLITLYNKYHSKGFSILSIADDKEKKEWLNAIQKDKIDLWYHAIENQEATIQKKLGIYAIPTFILVDNQMKIIGKFNGRWKGQEDLEKTIVEYLASYN